MTDKTGLDMARVSMLVHKKKHTVYLKLHKKKRGLQFHSLSLSPQIFRQELRFSNDTKRTSRGLSATADALVQGGPKKTGPILKGYNSCI